MSLKGYIFKLQKIENYQFLKKISYNIRIMKNPNHLGVHQTHCCIIHGCKYLDDDCPVVNKVIEQSYLCEDCEPHYNPWVSTTVELEIEVFELLKFGKKKYHVFDKSKYSLVVGQILEFKNSINDEKLMKIVSFIEEKEKGLSADMFIASFDRSLY